MTQFLAQNSDVVIRLFVAVILGILIGAERAWIHKEAGMKTHALVCLGSALFIVISETMAQKYGGYPGFNPTMMASQIIVGIGFLGAGSIMLQGPRVLGLTTAGALWVTAGIGMATGFGLYGIAVFSTFLVFFILIAVFVLESPLRKVSDGKVSGEKHDM